MKKRQRERAKRIPVADEIKNRVIRFRVTEKDFKAIHQAAEKSNSTVSLFLVECARSRINGLI